MYAILNKPPFRYDDVRKIVFNAENVPVLSLTGYHWMVNHGTMPRVLADKEENVFGQVVETMLNAKVETKEH